MSSSLNQFLGKAIGLTPVNKLDDPLTASQNRTKDTKINSEKYS